MSNPHMHYRLLWLLIGYAFIIFIFYGSLSSNPIEMDVQFFDKISHALSYFVLMGWFAQLYHQVKVKAVLAVMFIAMGISIEYLQQAGGVRYFEINDMLANTLGVVIAFVLSFTAFRDVLFKIDNVLAGYRHMKS